MGNHEFIPPDGVYVRFDPHTDARSPFVTTRQHEYQNHVAHVIVPAGFRCDFASVPGPLLWLFGPFDRHQRAALFHDAAYRAQYCSRFAADALFRQIMAADGVPAWKRCLMYYGVRLFGRRAWRQNAKNTQHFREILMEDDNE